MITGSIGMLRSARASEIPGTPAIYEPIHGSAPDIAGQDKANPLATILSGAMMLRTSFGLEAEAAAVERAVASVLDEGYRTGDILDKTATDKTFRLVGCKAMSDLVTAAVLKG